MRFIGWISSTDKVAACLKAEHVVCLLRLRAETWAAEKDKLFGYGKVRDTSCPQKYRMLLTCQSPTGRFYNWGGNILLNQLLNSLIKLLYVWASLQCSSLWIQRLCMSKHGSGILMLTFPFKKVKYWPWVIWSIQVFQMLIGVLNIYLGEGNFVDD